MSRGRDLTLPSKAPLEESVLLRQYTVLSQAWPSPPASRPLPAQLLFTGSQEAGHATATTTGSQLISARSPQHTSYHSVRGDVCAASLG